MKWTQSVINVKKVRGVLFLSGSLMFYGLIIKKGVVLKVKTQDIYSFIN